MKKGLLVFLVVLLAVPAVYAVVYPVCSSCFYKTITSCLNVINNTADGCSLNQANTVYTINSGKTYNVNFLDYPSIRLNAIGQTLDCNGSTIKSSPTGSYVIYVVANESTVKNCKLISGASAIFIDAAHATSKNMIFNNTFINSMYGIDLFADKSGSNHIGENNKFFDNLFYNSSIFVDGNGERICFNNTVVDGNTLYNGVIGLIGDHTNVTNNVVILPPNSEIPIQEGISGGAYFSLIEGNTVINARDGILIGSGTSNIIKRNNIINATFNGIWLTGGSNDIVTLNNITGTAENVNTITGAAGNGIWVEMYSPNMTISSNTITDSKVYGVYIESSNNIISGNTFNSNGGSANYSYYSSSYPRRWNNIDWSNIPPSAHGMLLLFNTDPKSILLNSSSTDVSSVVTGASNLSLALFNIPSVPSYGNLTAIFSDAVATDCAGLNSWFISNLGVPINCAYFESDAWIANGVGKDYTNSISSSTTTVSGFYTPTLARTINPISGAIYIANTGNSLTSNTFNSNTISVTVLSGVYNTISGGIINLDNDLSLYIPGNLNVVINALIIGSTSGNYYLYKDSNELNISNSKAGITWRISNLTLNANLGTNLLLGPGFISLNNDVLGGLNKKANVTITGVACDNFKLWYSSSFYSSLADIIANGAIVATNANINGDCTDTLICKHVQCLANTLKFEAQHFDSFGADLALAAAALGDRPLRGRAGHARVRLRLPRSDDPGAGRRPPAHDHRRSRRPVRTAADPDDVNAVRRAAVPLLMGHPRRLHPGSGRTFAAATAPRAPSS